MIHNHLSAQARLQSQAKLGKPNSKEELVLEADAFSSAHMNSSISDASSFHA